jgi:TrmH RNA methyltransferase
MKPKELTICGLAAVKAQFAANAAAIKRLYFDYATGRKIGVICKALAQAKKIYRCVEPAELEKVSGTVHHGGIVAVVAASELRAPTSEEIQTWSRAGEVLLVLDRIGNAHNLGAIARTAAFFGVKRIVIPSDPAAARPSEAAHRVAEGALSHLEVLIAPRLPDFLRDLARAGFAVVGAAAHGGRADFRTERNKPIALVLGNEEHGLATDVAAACTRLVTLPASGPMESLNVSAAAAVLLWILQRNPASS